jgi:two-component system sensor histidine kinase KdpD
VRGVEPALRAAVVNLVENAAQASPSGEAVEVSVRTSGKHVRLEIADRGPGLPDDVRERLFRPHVTTKVGGSGMGLFLARQLVVGMHGGSLDVADREGGGTTVSVTLPLLGVGAASESPHSG